MRFSTFHRGCCSQLNPIFLGTLNQPDNFSCTEFFKADNGLELRDINVYAKVDQDPEVRERVAKYMIENQIKTGYSSDQDDDQIFSDIQARFGHMSNDQLKALVSSKLMDLRAQVDKKLSSAQ